MAESNYLSYLLESAPEVIDEYKLMKLEKDYKSTQTLAKGCSYGAMVNALGDLVQDISDISDDMADNLRNRTLMPEEYRAFLGILDAFWEAVPGTIVETLENNCGCKKEA